MFKPALHQRQQFFIFNATKICHFKGKYSEMKKYPSCLGNISEDFSANNMKKRGVNGYV